MTLEKDRPVVVLGIDPGAGGAGYCAWDSERNAPLLIGPTCPSLAVDAIVVESGFVGKMGRKEMWGLGFDAGWRLCEALFETARWGSCIDDRIFTIRPDGVNGWRAALPARPDLHASQRFTRFNGLPGDAIVNRLRLRYGLGAERTEHEVEAVGIAEAAAAILQRPKAGQRKALVKVKR